MTLPEILQAALQHGAGLDPAQAEELTATIIDYGAAQGHGGTEHYWPKKYRALTKEERDEAIRDEFNGRNLKEICQKFGVSSYVVYQAVKRQ